MTAVTAWQVLFSLISIRFEKLNFVLLNLAEVNEIETYFKTCFAKIIKSNITTIRSHREVRSKYIISFYLSTIHKMYSENPFPNKKFYFAILSDIKRQPSSHPPLNDDLLSELSLKGFGKHQV